MTNLVNGNSLRSYSVTSLEGSSSSLTSQLLGCPHASDRMPQDRYISGDRDQSVDMSAPGPFSDATMSAFTQLLVAERPIL